MEDLSTSLRLSSLSMLQTVEKLTCVLVRIKEVGLSLTVWNAIWATFTFVLGDLTLEIVGLLHIIGPLHLLTKLSLLLLGKEVLQLHLLWSHLRHDWSLVAVALEVLRIPTDLSELDRSSFALELVGSELISTFMLNL